MKTCQPNMIDIEYILSILTKEGLAISKVEGKKVILEHDYVIEIENPHLFKLIESGYVIAPFDSMSELASFVKQDLQQKSQD